MTELNATLKEAPVQKITFKGREYWLKRDDLINHYFNGNKARKFQYFLEQDLSKYTTVASYGGNQSNAMYSLSAFAKLKI
jgi:1-aminocyclopropane-1-carboxylate deaminase